MNCSAARRKRHRKDDNAESDRPASETISGGKFFSKERISGNIKKRNYTGPLLGILPQNPQCLFVKDTGGKDLWEMTGKHGDRQRMEAVIDQMEIRHLLKAHPYDLSGGEQQRAALAKVLLLNPK